MLKLPHTMANQSVEHIKLPAFQHATNLNFSIQAEHSNLSLGISQIKGGGNVVQGAGVARKCGNF